jgi:hypothetical protein
VKATSSRKHIETTASVAESKRDQRSFIARVQAALRNADHAEPTEAPPRPSNTNPIVAHPPPALDVSAAVAAKPAGGTDVRSGPGLEAAPIQPNPPGPIEIESRPVAGVQNTPAPAPARETGVLSGLEEMLRHDPYAGSDDAPRPPMPVGQ